jgi:hypothetical protein
MVALSPNDPILCALCGRPVPIVEYTARICKQQRIIWHFDCYDADLYAGAGAETDDGRAVKVPWDTRIAIVRERGPNRVGMVEEY